MKKISCILLFTLFFTPCFSQIKNADSTKTLDSVIVRAFEHFTQRRLGPVTSFCCGIPVTIADYSSKTSMVNGLNTVSGVRMEERSPGSYRINIRGSSLRSPFGVRNIKVYWNDIPVTDPGGNTYFNQFAWNNFSDIYIHKGPAGSMYGAGSGGLVLLSSLAGRWQPGATIEYITGSYNLQNVFVSGRFGNKENKNVITYAHNQSDGYRVHTNMRRDNFSWISQVDKDKYQFVASLLYTNMYYQTPGALTLAEYNSNPKSPRPAGGGFPGAINAKASIYQKNFLAGFSNLFRFSARFKNTTTLYGAFAQIKNPAIRNYERRNEPSFGGRTIFNFHYKSWNVLYDVTVGAEVQQGYFNTKVSKNRNGNPDTLQSNDDIDNTAFSYFVQAYTGLEKNWYITGGLSINRTKVEITRRNSYPVTIQNRVYKSELSPRLSVSKDWSKFYFIVSVAKGFSPPTTAELLPSTGIISTSLEAEYGWNYEASVRTYLFNRKLILELTGFYFKLNNALVQRRDSSGADYFINAGSAKQHGIEFHAEYKALLGGGLFRNFTLSSDITLNNFHYGSFIKGTDDFSGKKLPSVPSSVISLLSDLYLRHGIYLRTTYYAASFIYLNDANTAKAKPYHILGCQLGWKKTLKKKFILNLYAGADNLVNETYSLGNDINAAANRFYNAAPKRNYYIGVSFNLIKTTNKNN
ncbi:MAG: TonB-dependent receptor plug domain-containing protein [Sphingobacteriales bacterium]|nr:TonB-dependent receptor plug domain-containing protein [Sphingobacteriales bacterium]